ncbi:hypothetical protein SDC9_212252 [bioreactor metagenome]|uniref:Uncharacterized protein n=1 Tax=bioreactor metagenome TaxID=1076179 RepID=A0A645JMB2_9ZZZZ
MIFLDFAYAFKKKCDLVEAFFFSLFGKSGIHVCPLIIFAAGSILEIDVRGRHAVMEQLEPNIGVSFFIAGSLLKNISHFFQTFFFSHGGIVKILGVGLAFAGKGCHQILFRLGSLQLFHYR